MIITYTGKGKFGMVFLAKQAAMQSSLHVAIKYIPKQTIYDSKGIAKTQQVHSLCNHCSTLTNLGCLRAFVSSVRVSTGDECAADV